MPERKVSVPGRVNLVGDHTDYNRGLVLPTAINRWCDVVVTPNGERVIQARSAQLEGTAEIRLDRAIDARALEPAWARFVAGAVTVLLEQDNLVDGGVDLAISSTVPTGAGLSSSSALAVALMLALERDARPDVFERARLALDVEVRATGVPGGLMDQIAVLVARRDAALVIDFDTEPVAYRPVMLPSDAAVLVAHCGVSRTLAGSEYGNRRAECEAIATRLGLASLRDATLHQVRDEPRGRHVVSENARVLAMVNACEAGDIGRMGDLMLESHASLRDDFEVSTPELDALVDAFVAAGASGARLTGAGFGGCVVAVTTRDRADQVLAAATRSRDAGGLAGPSFVAEAVDGALIASSDD